MNSILIKKQINNLEQEIANDKAEVENIPERFKQIIYNNLNDKENNLIILKQQLTEILQNETSDRLNLIGLELEKTINNFINSYNYELESDKSKFISQVSIQLDYDQLVVSIEDAEDNLIKTKTAKEKIKVKFPEGKIINEYKTTDTFVKVLHEIGIQRVIKLDIIILGLKLIGNIKSEKYQQRSIENGLFIVTQISNDKKVDLLNFISERLNLGLKVELN